MYLEVRFDIHYLLYPFIAVSQKVLHLCAIVQFDIDVFNVFSVVILVILHFDAYVMCWAWTRIPGVRRFILQTRVRSLSFIFTLQC